MELFLGVVVGLLIAAVIAALVRLAVGRGRPAQAPERHAAPTGTMTVTLDVNVADPEEPAVARLARETGSRALAANPGVETVRVLSRSGAALTTVTRHADVAPPPALPEQLSEPHRTSGHTPDPTGGTRRARARASVGDEPFELPPDRPFAERFDLPPAVRQRIDDPAEPVDVIRAILSTAGRPARVDGDMVLSGDVAVVVVGEDRGGPVGTERLNHAFLGFESSGARSGLVVCLGFVRPDDIHRREMLVPTLRYVGLEAVQRMADAVALGADPLAFATGAPLTTSD